MAPQGAQSARQGTQKARMRAPAASCVGCAHETPKGVSVRLHGRTHTLGQSKPIHHGQLAFAARERPPPPCDFGNGIWTLEWLRIGTIGGAVWPAHGQRTAREQGHPLGRRCRM